MTRGQRIAVRVVVIALVVVAVLIGGVAWYASTPQFEAQVRGYLVKTLEDATGGRVELGAFKWNLTQLAFEADNLTIHGLEGPDEVPYAHLDRLRVRVKIISFFQAKIGLNYLGVDHPVVHLIVYKDGSTNQPTPKTVAKKSSKSPVDTVFDLAVGRTEINNGLALFNQQALPFALAANALTLGVDYVPSRDHYTGTLTISDITAQRGIAPKIHSKLTVEADAGRNSVNIPSLHFDSGQSSLAVNANLSNFSDPHWQLAAKGTIDVREAEALESVPGLDSGVVALDLNGQGTKALFTVDGTTKLGGVTYRTSSANVSGLSAETRVHITQDELSLTDLRARLASGGAVSAEAHLYNWLSQPAPPEQDAVSAKQAAGKTPGARAAQANPSASDKLAATARAAHEANRAVAQATSNPAAKSKVSRGEVRAKLSGFTLQSILAMIAPPKYRNLGFSTNAAGDLDLHWTGDASDLAADTKIALTAPAHPANGNVPINGIIDASYAGRTSSLEVRQFHAQTPATVINVTGGVGLAKGAHSTLQVSVTASNLGEFNQALIAFGVTSNGKKGAAALPVSLTGQARFNGTVSGSLEAPDVKGHLGVTSFDVALNPTPAPAPPAAPTNPNGAPAEVPVAAVAPPAPGTPAAAATPQSIHIDSLDADAEYSPELVSVSSAVIVRGKTQVHASGQLHAHQILNRRGAVRRLAFDDFATLNADATINNAALPDLLALAGESTLPVSGTLNLNVHAGGTLGNLNGGGHLAVTGGQIYGEPYKSLNADLVFAGKELAASQLVFLQNGGTLSGNGGFNTASKQFHFNVQGTGFDLAHLQSLKKSPVTVGGQVTLSAQGSGTVAAPSLQATVHLANLSLSNPAGGPASTGFVDLDAHTAAGNLLLNLHGRLNGATVEIADQTAIAGPYQSQAKLTLANLDINPYLQLFSVQGVSAHSQIGGTVTVTGPLSNPKALNGEAQLSQIKIESQGIPIQTEGGLHATLRGGVATLDPLHVTGGGTDLHLGGSADVFGADRTLDVHGNGSLNLAIGHTLVPDLKSDGSVTFKADVGGTIDKPDVNATVTLANVNLAYADLPNGISQLNGTLVADQGRLVVQKLTGYSGGGLITVNGFVTYQQGLYADLTATGQTVRVRYAGISTAIDTKLRLQGTQQSLLLSGDLEVTRFTITPGLDAASLGGNGISPPPDPTSFGNKVRLDVHVTSAPQLNIDNSYAKLAGDIDLRVRGSAATPSVLGHISITEGSATFAGTHYELQHGDIYFSNPVRIEPTIDLLASAHVDNYDVQIGLNGTTTKLQPTFRSEPPLSEQDIFQLLAVGRTQEEQQIYSQQQSQAGVNSAADSLLGGALNATLSSRINKLFGGGSVKIDPTFVSGSGNSTARITVQQQVSKNGTVMYATNVNSTAQQLIQGQYNLSPDLSVLAVRDESGVTSLIVRLHRRYR